ncbi:LysR family transcriptional regulator [Schumannella soli]|uniref:LysR family transcriptional regulator n=1 Tax=Schumannella soli TaxID=2590779 RepID=A0A506Y9D4_9MICO|nr:LysR family transcriptional regulator [Schumannella soli]TPW78100.1 LysR family transcriptional regulator [Schumannella soli]
MEVHQLRLLRELAHLGSVSAVAAASGVSPSAVSQQLAALQRGFRTSLTRKQGRSLVLTDAGLALVRAGDGVLDAVAAARAAVDDYESDERGVVRLSGFHSAGQAIFGSLIAELAASGGPEVRFTDEDVAQDDFPALAARYDLVLAHRLDHSPPWPDDGVRVITLVHEPLDVALPASHRLARASRLRPADLIDERWVSSRVGFSPDDVLRAVAASAERTIDIVHRVNDWSTVASIVSTGDALGLLPRYTGSLAHVDGVVTRPLVGVGTTRSIDVLARPEILRRRAVRAVVESLRRVMDALAAGGAGVAGAGPGAGASADLGAEDDQDQRRG